ncbi:hydrogenase large subunit, partial [Thermococci archaeon]
MVEYWQWHPQAKEALYSMGVGTDERPISGGFVYMPVISVVNHETGEEFWIMLKAYLDPENPEFPSVASKVPAALWAEREVHDLLGLKPKGHPDLRRLILPEDWPEGV